MKEVDCVRGLEDPYVIVIDSESEEEVVREPARPSLMKVEDCTDPCSIGVKSLPAVNISPPKKKAVALASPPVSVIAEGIVDYAKQTKKNVIHPPKRRAVSLR